MTARLDGRKVLVVGAGVVSAFQVGKAPAALAAVQGDLALSLAVAAAEHGRRVYFTTLADLLHSLEEAQAAGRLAHRLRTLVFRCSMSFKAR